MKIRNDTDKDRHVFGIGFAKGATVAVPSGLGPAKCDWLRRNFTEVKAEPKPAAPKPVVDSVPVPVAEPTDSVPVPVAEPTRAPRRTSSLRGRKRHTTSLD